MGAEVILVVFGTTGELIKLAPVLVRLERGGAPYVVATTGQQVQQIPAMLREFGLRQPDVWLARGTRGRDLRTPRNIPGWLSCVARSFMRHRDSLSKSLARGRGKALTLVHGDTMTTVLGSLVGRNLGVPVAHIEGGLRSFDLRNPFPEELNRRLTSRLATVHYAPGAWAAANLIGCDVIDTGANTIVDSLDLVSPGLPSIRFPAEPFGVVSLHRFELLSDRRALTETLTALRAASGVTPLLFVDHPVTVAAVDRFGLGPLLGGQLQRIPRLPFFDYVRLQRRCGFVVTDSGGSQEECFYLDIPCLVHRRRTERREGIGENAIVSGLSTERLRSFLEDPGRYRRRAAISAISPSDVIVGDLRERGVVVV